MEHINKLTQPFPDIFAIYFGEHWACPGMPDQTQQALHDLTKASMDIYAKNEVFEILKLKKSRNRIGRENFGL